MDQFLGNRIKNRREELGLTQDELARLVGYKGRSSVQKIEGGFSDVPRKKVPLFAKALGMTEDELLGQPTKDLRRESFGFYVEQMLRLLGYTVIYDAEGNVLLTDGETMKETTEEALQKLEERYALYMRFLVEELRKEKAQ